MKIDIDVETDCTITEAVDNKQENVILAVYTGEADAGFIRESALRRADSYISPAQIKILGETAWLPNWAFSVSRSLPEKIKKDFQAAVLLLKPNHPVMLVLKIDIFRTAEDVDYDPVRLAAGLK